MISTAGIVPQPAESLCQMERKGSQHISNKSEPKRGRLHGLADYYVIGLICCLTVRMYARRGELAKVSTFFLFYTAFAWTVYHKRGRMLLAFIQGGRQSTKMLLPLLRVPLRLTLRALHRLSQAVPTPTSSRPAFRSSPGILTAQQRTSGLSQVPRPQTAPSGRSQPPTHLRATPARPRRCGTGSSTMPRGRATCTQSPSSTPSTPRTYMTASPSRSSSPVRAAKRGKYIRSGPARAPRADA